MSTEAQFNTTAPSGSDQHWRVPQNSAPRLILSASQEQRVHGSIFNNSTAALYIKFGNDVGMAVSGGLGLYDLRLTSASYFELPHPAWQGEVWGAWENDLPAGFAMVLQLGRPDR